MRLSNGSIASGKKAYRKTKGLPLEAWLPPVDREKAARASRRLGLPVRVAPAAPSPCRPFAPSRSAAASGK